MCNPLINLLIPSTGNSARSHMAEGLLRRDAGDRFTVESAGTKPSSVRPEAIAVLKEVGVDITSQRSKHVDEFAGQDFDCPTIGQEHLFQPPEHWLGQLGWAGR